MCRATPGEMVTDNKVTVDGLTGGKQYEFRVAAVNEIGRGEYVQTKEGCTPPSSFYYIPLSIFVKKRTHESFVKFCFHTDTKQKYSLLVEDLRTYIHFKNFAIHRWPTS